MKSSQAKMLEILNLFSDVKVDIRPEDVEVKLLCSRATAYRYLKSLSYAGMLVSTGGGAYVLGPKIIELERLIRRNDPLLTTARPYLEKLSLQLNVGVMLCSYYGDRVLLADAVWVETEDQPDYERGRPMSMFSGAMAKVILANVTPYQLRKLMLNHAVHIQASGLGSDWKAFSTNMQKIRREGTCVTHSEVVKGLVGVAAPIFDPDDRVVGSITLAIKSSRWDKEGQMDRFRQTISLAAQTITEELSILRSKQNVGNSSS